MEICFFAIYQFYCFVSFFQPDTCYVLLKGPADVQQ